MVPVGRDRPPAFGGEPLGRVAVVDRADRLRRPREGRVVTVDDHLGEQGGDRPAAEGVEQLLVEQVADHSLRLGPQHVERVRRDGVVSIALQGEQPDLRAVAVGHDHLVVPSEVGDRLDGRRDVAALRGGVGRLVAPQQCVASECDDDAHGDHSHSPVVRAYSTACSVASRLAACSKTSDCGPSMTAAATSSPRWAGRQCRKTAPGAACAISDGVT